MLNTVQKCMKEFKIYTNGKEIFPNWVSLTEKVLTHDKKQKAQEVHICSNAI